eukprot:357291-Chlamydomonas_euryale.AAC.4
MTRCCARHGGRRQSCATLPSVRPSSRGVLLIQVQAWPMVLFAMIVIRRQKIWNIASGTASVKSKECVCVCHPKMCRDMASQDV